MVDAYTLVAALQSGKGDLAGGLATFREGARMAERLERAPGIGQQELLAVINLFEQKGESELGARDIEAMLLMDLSFSCEHLASALADSSPEQAAVLYRRALAITRAMLEKSPREFRYRRRQAAQLRLLAAPLRNLGDRRGALHHLKQATEQLQLLMPDHPGHAGLQLDRHWMSLDLADQAVLVYCTIHDGTNNQELSGR